MSETSGLCIWFLGKNEKNYHDQFVQDYIILAFVGLLRVQASYSLDMQRNKVITCMITPFCVTVNK